MGIPVVIVDSGGLPVTESDSAFGTPMVEAENGFGMAVTFVESGGLPVVGISNGARIQLSASTIAENASVGDLVGTLSVSNGSGDYTFTLTDDAGGLFALDASDDTLLEVAGALDYETAPSLSVTVQADNGVDDPISRTITITVTDVEEPDGPAAPVLTWVTDESDDTPGFLVTIDDTIVEGDNFQFQRQTAGGDWSGATTTDQTITSGEDVANEIALELASLANGDYEARCRVSTAANPTLWSDWSNVVDFTINVPSSYSAVAVRFTRSDDDVLYRNGGLTGRADSKVGIVSFWLNLKGNDAAFQYVFNLQAGGSRLFMRRTSGNVFEIIGRNSSNTTILNMLSSTTYTTASGWVHVLLAWDLANAVGQMYVNDTDVRAGSPTLTNDNIDISNTFNCFIGDLSESQNNSLDADIADFYLNTAETLDFSVESNRRKFISAGGKPVDLGSDGSTPTGTAPIVLLSGGDSTDWHINDGSGGGMTVLSGALSAGASSPSD